MKSLFLFVLLVFGVSLANTMQTGTSHYNFALYTISQLETVPTQCDKQEPQSHTNIESMCGYFQHGNVAFINAWENIVLSDVIQSNYSIFPVTDWLYFYDSNNVVEDIKRAYTFDTTTLIVGYNHSLKGRELKLSVGVLTSEVLSQPNSRLNFEDLGISNYQATKTDINFDIQVHQPSQTLTQNNYPNNVNSSTTNVIHGAFNCEDFGSRERAQAFFIENGFNKDYDPYNLDGDGNGIPCESIGETVGQDSRCPVGKYWVDPYTRKDGANVKGHCRKKR